MIKTHFIVILLVLVLTMLFTACGGQTTSSPVPTANVETKPAEEPVVTQPVEEPVETSSVDITYPAPVDVPANPLPIPYPGPGDGVNPTIDWSKVEDLLLSGQVAKVYHKATMEITLVLKDGRMVLAMEPSLNEVFAVIERCGDPCKDIERIEE